MASAPSVRILVALERQGDPGDEWTATVLTTVHGEPVGGQRTVGPHDAPGVLLEELGLELDEAETQAIVGARRTPAAVESTHRRRPHG